MAECQIALDMPLVALLPTHPEFDEEAELAAQSLPVLRFIFTDVLTVEHLPDTDCRAIFRGFMLSAQRYSQFYGDLAALRLHLVVSPKEYEKVHYYPCAYPALTAISPRAAWVTIDAEAVQPEAFTQVLQKVTNWGCSHVVLKDFVKSAKTEGNRFMKVAINNELPDLACEFVHIRGRRFNRGVVFKEWVELEYCKNRGEYVTNEWRLWFCRGELLAVTPNSFQDDSCDKVPEAMIAAACEAAKNLASPYLTIDLAEGVTGWIALEAGDGGVSGPAPNQNMAEHWAALAHCFGKGLGRGT